MASADQIAALRRAVDVADDDATYTEQLLGALFDALGHNTAALTIWREKMATYAKMVTVAEGGASRSMSDLYRHAKEMVEMYERLVANEAVPGTDDLDGYAYTVQIERP